MIRRPPRSTLFPYPTLFRSFGRAMDMLRFVIKTEKPPVDLELAGGNPITAALRLCKIENWGVDRKSTRLNSSHLVISYAVFCLKKKKRIIMTMWPLLTITHH